MTPVVEKRACSTSCSRYKRGDESERKKAKRVDEERSEEEREAKNTLSLSLSLLYLQRWKVTRVFNPVKHAEEAGRRKGRDARAREQVV